MTDDQPPEGFIRLRLPPAGFIDVTGPLYGRMMGGRFALGLRVRDRHCNAAGVCHGGMLATFADMLLAMGSNLQAELSSFLLTVNLTCDFLGTVPAGVWLEGHVDVLRITRTLVFSQGLVTFSERHAARVSGILKRPNHPDPAFGADRFFSVREPRCDAQ